MSRYFFKRCHRSKTKCIYTFFKIWYKMILNRALYYKHTENIEPSIDYKCKQSETLTLESGQNYDFQDNIVLFLDLADFVYWSHFIQNYYRKQLYFIFISYFIYILFLCCARRKLIFFGSTLLMISFFVWTRCSIYCKAIIKTFIYTHKHTLYLLIFV